MIVLDSNVLSELMQPRPQAAVVKWLDAQPPESVWTTTITIFEMMMGLELLPAGQRRRNLEAVFESLLGEDLEGRVLSFDEPAAREAAILSASRQRAGRPVDIRDTQIAGIVLARRATLATRNVRHFEALPSVVNPWNGI